MSTPAIYRAVLDNARGLLGSSPPRGLTLLDLGAGHGDLIALFQQEWGVEATALDFHIERFHLKDVPIHQGDLNRGPLPFAAASFDLVTASEVLEHLENPRALLREAARVLKPGGIAIFTTPNALNLKSRLRFLLSGFFNLFGPLPMRNDKLYSVGGHITPLPFFYLAHGMMDAGFEDLRVTVDKRQRSSSAWLLALGPLVLLGRALFLRQETRFQTLTPENRPLVARHWSLDLLTGRTVVVGGRCS
ncbi:MAG: methyltransferase domain-containing protein [Magnetococcales bacterium]|nr:methyltransferase domain-containing protein [Magnetococcales bacterium]